MLVFVIHQNLLYFIAYFWYFIEISSGRGELDSFEHLGMLHGRPKIDQNDESDEPNYENSK